jgi:plasmid stability protein
MTQLTIRADDELVDRVKQAAVAQGRSMNDYVTAVLDAATDPALAGDAAERLRARLRMAGLLWEPPAGSARPRPHAKAVAAARKRAGRGTPLSDHVRRDRGA